MIRDWDGREDCSPNNSTLYPGSEILPKEAWLGAANDDCEMLMVSSAMTPCLV